MATIEKSVEVKAPITPAYNQWTQFEDFPQFMQGIDEIRQLDDRRLHWRASFGGETHEWDAEITEQLPDERVAWRNVEGKDNAGVVTFHKIDDGTTRVMLQMDWAPEGLKEKGRQRTRRRGAAHRGRPRALQGVHRVARRSGDRRLARRGPARGLSAA
jgi:uncharacterized membrane protein